LVTSKKEDPKLYKKFYDSMVELSKDNFEKNVFEYFDFTSWVKSKIENSTFRKVVEEKAANK
jgi:hypothetical protein